MSDNARVTDASNQAVAVRIVVSARYRAQSVFGEVFVGSRREFADRCQVLSLEFVLPVDPLPPCIVQGQAEHTLELPQVRAFAVIGSLDPFDKHLR